MPKLSLKITLAVFNRLMGIKRAITFLFSRFSFVLEKFGRFLVRFFVFPGYKIYLILARRLSGFSRALVGPGRLIYFLILVVILILMASETSAYASNQYLSGRQSLLFAVFGSGEEGEITEEWIEESAFSAAFAPSWEQGAVKSDVLGLEEESELEIFSQTSGQEALLQPSIMPGADIGAGRYEIIKYAIQPGDTIGGLAQKFKISANTILIENKLSVYSLLRPGDVLTILPVSGLSHKVKKGDTIKKIASLYQADASKILEFNRLSDENLPLGEVIIVPEGKRPAIASPAPAYAVSRPPSIKTAVVGMLWPAAARRITQYFRWRHTGIDIAGPKGTPIYASDSGLVETAGWNRGGYGYQIVINHGNNLKTRYAHNSQNYAVAGQRVEKGEVIALIGSTGRSTGPHLHFEVMVGGVRVNPFLYVR